MLSIVLSRHGLSPSRPRFKHIQLQLIFPNWSLHSIASRTIYVSISSLLRGYPSTCYAWHQHLLKLKNSLNGYKIKIPCWFLRSTPRFCKPHIQSLLLFIKNSMAWFIFHVVWLTFILQICRVDSFVLNNQILVGLGVIGCVDHFVDVSEVAMFLCEGQRPCKEEQRQVWFW